MLVEGRWEGPKGEGGGEGVVDLVANEDEKTGKYRRERRGNRGKREERGGGEEKER